MSSIKNYIKYYDIETKTQSIICEGKVVDRQTFAQCPYVWFGDLKEKIEKGLIEFVAWKMRGFVCLTGR